MRIEPPWSPPKDMSASPAATRTAEPEEEPPAEKSGLCGLRTGKGQLVLLLPDEHKYSHTALPTISPPASRIRVTTVASASGTKPCRKAAPTVIGTPARHMLSLRTTFLPDRGPPGLPFMLTLRAQALYLFSGPSGW